MMTKFPSSKPDMHNFDDFIHVSSMHSVAWENEGNDIEWENL